MIERILHFRAGMAVQRYHTVNLIVRETVGHHSCNVAWLVTQLTDTPSRALIQAALLHDAEEIHTGDVPATTKWRSKMLRDSLDDLEHFYRMDVGLAMPVITENEKVILKQADMLDLCFKMVEELSMGNQQCANILSRGTTYLWENQPLPQTKELLLKLEELMPLK